MFCANCGKTLKDGAKFCPFCGTPQAMVPKAPQPAANQAPAGQAPVNQAPVNQAPAGQTQTYQAPRETAPAPQQQMNAGLQTIGPEQGNAGLQTVGPETAAPAAQAAASQTAPYPYAAPGSAQQPQQPQQMQQQVPNYQNAPAQNPQGVQPAPVQNGGQPTKEKKKKKWLIPVIIAAAVMLLLLGGAAALFFFLFNNQTETVDINDYLVVTFEGYDGKGQADWDIDVDGLVRDYGEKLKWKKKGISDENPARIVAQSVYPSLSSFMDLSNGDEITVTWETTPEISTVINVELVAEDQKIKVSGLEEVKYFDPFDTLEVVFNGYNGAGYVESARLNGTDPVYDWLSLDYGYTELHELSNGDEVTFSLDIMDSTKAYILSEYGMSPSAESRTVKVEGLLEVETFDPFEGLVVTFGGWNGSGYVDYFDKENADPICENLYYEYDYEAELSNGDELRVWIDEEEYTSDWFLETYGKLPSVFEQTYVVSGLRGYYQDLEDIPLANTIEYDQGFSSFYEGELAEYLEHGFSVAEIRPVGNILLVRDPDADTYNYYDNILYKFYQIEIAVEGKENGVFYLPVYVTDVQFDEEGNCSLHFDEDAISFATSEIVHLETSSYYIDFYGISDFESLKQVITPEYDSINEGMKEAGSTLSAG